MVLPLICLDLVFCVVCSFYCDMWFVCVVCVCVCVNVSFIASDNNNNINLGYISIKVIA